MGVSPSTRLSAQIPKPPHQSLSSTHYLWPCPPSPIHAATASVAPRALASRVCSTGTRRMILWRRRCLIFLLLAPSQALTWRNVSRSATPDLPLSKREMIPCQERTRSLIHLRLFHQSERFVQMKQHPSSPPLISSQTQLRFPVPVMSEPIGRVAFRNPLASLSAAIRA